MPQSASARAEARVSCAIQRLLAAALVLVAEAALAQAVPPQQTEARVPVHIEGNFNNATVKNNFYTDIHQMDPAQVAALVLRGLEEKAEQKDDADKKRLRAELEKARRASDKDRDTLRKLTDELLTRDRKLEELTQANLQLRLKLQEQINTLPEGQAKAETQSALDDADFKRVTDLLDRERMETKDYTNVGPLIGMASDRIGGIGGLAAGLYLDGIHMPGIGGRTVGLIPMMGSGELLLGSAREEGSNSFLLSLASVVGPRLRLGAPQSLLLGVSYYCPFFMITRGHVRFPLIGAGASLGFQTDQTHISVVYRYSMTHILYSDEPNMHFLGLTVAFPGQLK